MKKGTYKEQQYKRKPVFLCGIALSLIVFSCVCCVKRTKPISGDEEYVDEMKGIVIQSTQGTYLYAFKGEGVDNEMLYKLSGGYSKPQDVKYPFSSGEIVVVRFSKVFDLDPPLLDVVSMDAVNDEGENVDKNAIMTKLKKYDISSDFE